MIGKGSSGSRSKCLRTYCKKFELKAETDEEAEALAVIYYAWATGKISAQEIAALISKAQGEPKENTNA